MKAALYNEVVNEVLAQIELAKEEGGGGGKGLIFKLITSLKLICDHPLIYKGNPRPVDEEEEEEQTGGEEGDGERPHGDEASLAKDSGKVMKLLEILRNVLEKGEKVGCLLHETTVPKH